MSVNPDLDKCYIFSYPLTEYLSHKLKFTETTITLLPYFLKQKLMHQKIGLCGLYVAVSNTVLFIPDKGGSSVLMVGDEVLQCLVYSQ
jgi:hypothetical protein